MKGSEFFPSKYLKAEEIVDLAPLTVTVKSVVAEILSSRDKGDESKPVIYFTDLPAPLDGGKGIILNKTNWYTIASLYGDDSDAWTDKQIVLVVVDVDAFGDVVSAIRVKKVVPKAARPEHKPLTVEQAGEIKTPKGKRVADLTADEMAFVRKTLGPDSTLRQAVEVWTAGV